MFEGWSQRKEARANKAAAMITNVLAKNAEIIKDKLDEIQPELSTISADEQKKVAKAIQYAIQLLDNDQIHLTDIRLIDEKILQIADHLAYGVKEGNENQAKYARAALVIGLDDIRKDIPSIYSGNKADWVNKCAAYLQAWLDTIEYADKVDSRQKNIDALAQNEKAQKEKHQATIDDLERRLRDTNDPLFALMDDIANTSTLEDRKKWTPEHWNLQTELVDKKVYEYTINFSSRLLEYQKQEQQLLLGQLEQMKMKILQKPDFSDPDLYNRYLETVDELFTQMTEADARINTGLEALMEQNGRLEQLETAPGGTRMRELAGTAARETMKALLEKQKEREDNVARAMELRKQMGVLTEEEMEELEQYEANIEELRQQETLLN